MKKNYNKYVLSIFAVVFLLSICSLVRAQNVKPQTTIVNINIKGKPLSSVFKEIEQQTGYKFNYDQNEIDLKQQVNITSKTSLKATLDALSSQLGLDFGISGSSISVRKGERKTPPQVRLISGLVINDGLPTPGVNIFKKGTRQGAVTNGEGQFTLRLTGDNLDNTILEFIYIGMQTKEVVLTKQTYLKVEMTDDVFGMNEVVVTGSYTKEKRREDVVGSIAQVSAEKLQTDRPIESFDKMLEGLVAGVQVETTTELNTPVKINIRGQGSLPTFGASRGTSTQPLFVIDGIPAYEQQRGNEASVFNGETYLNPLSNINPDDIKSIAVLKDATASALYGANAANGVIIITTKGGSAGKTRLNFSYDTGVATFINEYKWLSGPKYYSLLRETYINGGRSVTEATQLAGSNTINTDWFDLTQRNAVYQNAGLDVSGGSDKTTFRFASGYRNQQASSLGNDLEKIYVRLRVDHQLANKFKVGFNFSPTFTESNALSNYGDVLLPPNFAPYNTDGTYSDFSNVPNPLAVLAQNEQSNKGMQLLANANANYQITDEIAISATFGADSYQNKQKQYQSALNATGRNANGRLEIYDRNYLGYTGFVQATYDKVFKEKHTVNFLVGTQVENKNTDLLRGQGSGYTYDRLRVLNLAAIQTSASSSSSDATISYYSQLGYDFAKKYYANINGRLDKSSIFGGDKQVAFNGSVGLAWVISNEDFLKDNKTLSFLKLRTTYGSTGNSRIGTYAARGLYDFGTASGNSYNGNVASYPENSSAPNPDLGWEKNYKLNFGLDFTLFNKLQVTGEYFSNTIEDLISSVYVPLETGYSLISANTGKMRNSGFELSINSEILERKNFNWNLSFNLGTSKNKLISFNNGYSALYSAATDAAGLRVGSSSTAIYGYKWAGVNPQNGAEQFFNANGEIKTANEIQALPISSTSVLGDRLPDFQGGMVNAFNLYDFNLSFTILYSYGASKLVSYVDESDGRNLQNRNQSVNLIDRWQRAGDITDIPKLLLIRDVVANSSRYLYDASYLKLANVSLGYKLPKTVSDRLHLNNASLFANATNLLYVYKDAGTKGRNGIAERRFVYPETSAFTFGIKVGL
ncbi:SusC/RagA family TonB-linked outer membrane protein [Pedobacter frigiditerrae]|uniref:SusC/RagA family TonB-linked outer membrane protein n=1 Tax=Pedobacter frigiditerrae TaxID=2530452 RepID=A0A4R0MQ81_9SPHI|nr:SusC/RagA family TonB-linked outer membrane protein [Pedobacter frigiditerrae]TCC88717.1 SusC/RagA family TonB-linked outer membrane protein [Pedobacter frigiditerrae]